MVALFHCKKIDDRHYQIYKAKVVQPITIQETPTSELLNEIQNSALPHFNKN